MANEEYSWSLRSAAMNCIDADVANAVAFHWLHHAQRVICCHSECCVPSGLDFEAAAGSVVPYCLCLKALSRWKHDMGALLWLHVETFTLWQTWKVLRPWVLFRGTTVITYSGLFGNVKASPNLTKTQDNG